MDKTRKQELLRKLIDILSGERSLHLEVEDDLDKLWERFRALVNTRPAIQASDEFLALQDELLQSIIAEKGICCLDDCIQSPINDHIYLWKGDITTLAVDGIVNAANNQMLGCHVPGHKCIDNAIHTFSGVQLRLECSEFMEKQGHPEPTGQAKITQAYNLPSKRILHTVGPITSGAPSKMQCEQLSSCYRSCLDLAYQSNLSSLAFCCISTGMFGFPEQKAAEIAVASVSSWLEEHHDASIDVVFDVYLESDLSIYQELLNISA